MKSDERHDLQRNDLRTLWQKHGNKVLLALTVCFLVLAAVRYQRNQKAEREAQTQAALTSAWDGVRQLPRYALPDLPPEAIKARTALVSDINQSAQSVLDDPAATPAQAAAALLARGQTYWALAHAPAAAASTQPASQPAAQSPAELLDLAAAAYKQVVADYAGQSVPTTVARFSLAAIDEERGDIDAARAQYKSLIETPNFTSLPTGSPPDAKSPAEARLAMLDTVAKPALLLPATQPTAPPPATEDLPTLPGLTEPTLPNFHSAAPSSRPTPVAPTVQPSSQPSTRP